MQNRILLTILLVSISIFSIAQLSAVGYKSDQYEKFITTKTYVVKMDEFYFDGNMDEAMKDWKITPYEFITNAEFKAKVSDKTASFILPVTIFTGTRGQEYHYLALINGGRKDLSYYDYNDMLAYAVINHYGNEVTNISCAHRVHNMISSMINAMELVKKNDIKGNPKKIVDNLMEYYRSLSNKIPKRILLVNKAAIGNKMTEEEFGKIYQHKFEFCTQEKLAQVIREKDARYYYYQPGITLNKSMFVFDPATGEVVYGDYQMMGLNINKKNVEMLVEAIERK